MIERDEVDGIAVLRLAHGKVNALDFELVTAIAAAFTELATSPHRAVVLTGAGRAFCAGVDLHRVAGGGAPYVRQYLPALAAAFEAVFNLGKPVVGAVNGHAIAGGCILVCACDHRVMAGGRIGVTELLVGVPFPAAALAILTYALGEQRARRAVLTGATWDPLAAAEFGLVDEVVDGERLLDHAIGAADRLATAVPADTFELTKRQLRAATNDRIAALRGYDDEVTGLWEARVADGWIARYMANLRSAR